MKWTMFPEALTSAMHKTQPLYTERAYSFLRRLAFVPYIPDNSRPRRNPDTPIIVTGRRETNMPLPKEPTFAKPLLPSVKVRIEKLEESLGRPI